MAKVTDPTPRFPEPDYDSLPTWDEMADQIEDEIRAQPGFKAYDGPPVAELIRQDRDSH